MFQFQQKLKYLKMHIKQWNQSTFGNIFQDQNSLAQEMKKIQQTIITEVRTEALSKQEKNLQNQIVEREKQDEILWKQKSRVRWIKEGERNTKFFHHTTMERKTGGT